MKTLFTYGSIAIIALFCASCSPNNPACQLAGTITSQTSGSNTILTANVSGGSGTLSYQWSSGSSTSNTLIATTTGNYCCTVTDSHGCQSVVLCDSVHIASSDYYKWKGTTYSPGTNIWSSNNQTIMVTSVSGNSFIAVTFDSWPPAVGTYHIINGISPGPSEVGLSYNASQSSQDMYLYTTQGNLDATMTQSGGKLAITIPNISMMNLGGTDTGSFSAHLTQP